jgi:hypothetical protein
MTAAIRAHTDLAKAKPGLGIFCRHFSARYGGARFGTPTPLIAGHEVPCESGVSHTQMRETDAPKTTWPSGS